MTDKPTNYATQFQALQRVTVPLGSPFFGGAGGEVRRLLAEIDASPLPPIAQTAADLRNTLNILSLAPGLDGDPESREVIARMVKLIDRLDGGVFPTKEG